MASGGADKWYIVTTATTRRTVNLAARSDRVDEVLHDRVDVTDASSGWDLRDGVLDVDMYVRAESLEVAKRKAAEVVADVLRDAGEDLAEWEIGKPGVPEWAEDGDNNVGG